MLQETLFQMIVIRGAFIEDARTIAEEGIGSKSQNKDEENKRHGCIIDFSNYDISRIIKTLP